MDSLLNLVNIRTPQGKAVIFVSIFAGFIYAIVTLIKSISYINDDELEMILWTLLGGLFVVCFFLSVVLTDRKNEDNKENK